MNSPQSISDVSAAPTPTDNPSAPTPTDASPDAPMSLLIGADPSAPTPTDNPSAPTPTDSTPGPPPPTASIAPRQRGKAIAVTDDTRQHYRTRQWWSPTVGVRLPAGRQELTDRCDAVLLAIPEAVISGVSAAALWGLPVPESATRRLEITVPDGHPLVRRRGVRCRRRDVPASSIHHLEDRPVIAPARLFVDLGGELSLPWLVALGDVGLQRGLLDERRIIRALAESTGHRGIRRARQALELLDPRAESPPESIMRVMLYEAGIDDAIPQYVVTDTDGEFVARVDLALVDARIAIEYDGAHHLTPEQQAADAVRRQKLEMLGWMVITVNSRDVHEPGRLARRVRAALAYRRRPHRP